MKINQTKLHQVEIHILNKIFNLNVDIKLEVNKMKMKNKNLYH